MITEFACQGNMRDFLRSRRLPDSMSGYEKPVSSSWQTRDKSLTYKNLISFAYQIARGMEYLASKKVKLRKSRVMEILKCGMSFSGQCVRSVGVLFPKRFSYPLCLRTLHFVTVWGKIFPWQMASLGLINSSQKQTQSFYLLLIWNLPLVDSPSGLGSKKCTGCRGHDSENSRLRLDEKHHWTRLLQKNNWCTFCCPFPSGHFFLHEELNSFSFWIIF